ncbi:SMC domain protein, partial [mine drainage metagenome]
MKRSIVKEETELRYLDESEQKGRAKMEELGAMVKKGHGRKDELSKSVAQINENIKKYRELVEKEKAVSKELYGRLDAALSGTGLHASKKELAKMRELRDQLEKLRIDLAGKKKESEMVTERLAEVKSEMKATADRIKALKDEGSSALHEMSKLNDDLLKLREKIKGYDDNTKGIYQEISRYEDQISKLSNEKGRISSELERINRSMLESEMKKAQSEVRLGDIRAELSTYGKYEAVDLPIEEIERELGRCKLEIERLGTINMKAPELYESRKRDVDEAQAHMKT